jgi:membrane protease subunit (stomatin/prohibitin family)
VIRDQGINIFELDSHMDGLSRALRDRISPSLEEYGLAVSEFYIMRIDLPEDNKDLQEIRKLLSRAYLAVRAKEVEASIAEAARQRKLIEAQTEAQVQAMRAQGEAEAARAVGMAEADVMRAKGYSQKDVLEKDVQVAYAESLVKMGSSCGGSAVTCGGPAGGRLATDMVGIMASLKMAETMFDKMGNLSFGNNNQQAPAAPASPAAPTANSWTCSCGEAGNVGRFCMTCGNPIPEAWDCSCGHKGNRGKFCEECGSPKEAASWDCSCGQTGNTGKCCPECGAKRP